MVQTFKQAMRRTKNDGPCQHRIANFLLTYRTTPHTTTNVAPCTLLMGRSLRTRLDMIRPNLDSTVCAAQAKQKQHHDEHSKSREFLPGDNVWTRDFRNNETKWISGVVLQSVGPLSYMIQLDDGTLWKRHIDHIRSRVVRHNIDTPISTPTSNTNDTTTETSPFITYPLQPSVAQNNNEETISINSPQLTVPRRNPPRDVRQPKRFQT